ncbi:hypothetical protein GA0070616_3707 [Micromonospora nigra]|uniref:Uncharacterized protein n=1 Tax=Micromonospora nigra TaxID=145857 RepID=A0A1C6SG94_9ACTN|nr:hypothetical protein [Micromonospora nigra]SCL28510.1 hypothetical protein GA0070616_3707 [Micromonospora nigra]
MDHPPGGNQRHRIERELANVLAEMPLMQYPDRRQQMVRRLRKELRRNDIIPDMSTPLGQSQEIAADCLDLPDGMAALIAVVRLYDEAAPELPTLRRLRYESEVLAVLPEDDWGTLREALTAVRSVPLTRLVQEASGHREDALPTWCANAWDALVHLAGLNAGTDLPPTIRFLTLLEPEVDDVTADLIRRRNRREARQFELTDELDRQRVAVRAGPERTQRYAYLVIQIERDLEPGSTSYTVSHYRQWHGDGRWHSRLRGRAAGVARDELEPAVEQIVQLMEIEWADRPAEVAIELVLETHLLNEDFPWWRKEAAGEDGEHKVLAMDYTIVVRSLQRLRRPAWRRMWRLRWEKLQASPRDTRLYRSQPDGPEYPTRLEALLSDEQNCAAILLSEPPSSDPDARPTELLTALRAGLPVVLWHRLAPSDGDLYEHVSTLTAHGLADLPALVRRTRLAALRSPQAEQDQHHGRHLVVLWDDPERRPETDSRGSPEVIA